MFLVVKQAFWFLLLEHVFFWCASFIDDAIKRCIVPRLGHLVAINPSIRFVPGTSVRLFF